MIPRSLRSLVALALAALALAAPAHATDPGDIVAAKRALQEAVARAEPAPIIAVHQQFAALSKAAPKSAALHYWVALADWRIVPLLNQDAKTAERYCTDGLTHIDRAIALAPRVAEARALRAALQGLSLQFNPGAAMTLGGEMEQAYASARAADPKNPRIQFFLAINTFHKPEFVGGGASPALAQLKKAQELFAAESVADSTAPDWGRDDAWLWAGRAAMALKDYAQAKADFEKALEITPTHLWVKMALLPQAAKALAADDKAKP